MSTDPGSLSEQRDPGSLSAPRLAALAQDPRSESKGPSPLDLRILTPGLTEEEIAAVTSVIAAMVEEQRTTAERESPPPPRWSRSVGALGPGSRGASAWRSSLA